MGEIKPSYWIVNTEDGSFLTDINDFIGNKVYTEYVWEPALVATYKALLQPEYTVLDVGAHMGFHTIVFASSANMVYAFEPQRHLYNQVCGNIALNELSDRVFCYNVGLGEVSKRSSFGSLEKHNTLTWRGNTGIAQMNYGGRSLEDNLGTDEIEIRTLDSFQLAPDLIKIDVESYELKVLQGATRTIAHHKPIIIVEVFSENQDEVFSLLCNLGYIVYELSNEKLTNEFVALHPQFKDYFRSKSILDTLYKQVN